MICELAVVERSRDCVIATLADIRETLFCPAPRVNCLIAEDTDTGSPVAMAVWFLNYSTWHGRHGIYLEDLFVRPAWRGAGIGRALLAELARICRAEGYTRLQWWVLDWNTEATAFYRALGAEEMAEWTVYRVSGQALASLAAQPRS